VSTTTTGASSTPASVAPSASATASAAESTAAPTGTSDADKYAAITPAYKAYWAAIDDTRNDGGGDGTATQAIDTLGTQFHTPDGSEFQRPKERYRAGTATMRWLDGHWKLTGADERNTEAC